MDLQRAKAELNDIIDEMRCLSTSGDLTETKLDRLAAAIMTIAGQLFHFYEREQEL